MGTHQPTGQAPTRQDAQACPVRGAGGDGVSGLRRATRLARTPWSIVAGLTAMTATDCAMRGNVWFAVAWAVVTVLTLGRVFVATARETEE